jgi:hypothetical protein
MTTAEQRELFKQALALPRKARLDLRRRLLESLEEPKEKVSRKDSVAETTAVYGKAGRSVRDHVSKSEVSSRKEWNEAWTKELKIRAKEMETGADPGVPLDEVLKFLDEKPRRRP